MPKELSLLDIYLAIPKDTNLITHKGLVLVRGEEIKVTFTYKGNTIMWSSLDVVDARTHFPLRDLNESLGSIEDFESFCKRLEELNIKREQRMNKGKALLLSALELLSK